MNAKHAVGRIGIAGMALGLSLAQTIARADTSPDVPSIRARAFEIFKGNDPQREEMLKKLHDEAPSDGLVCFCYGYSLLVRATTMDPGRKRIALIKEGRGYVLQAQKSGLNQPLIEVALTEFHEDGTFIVSTYSKNEKVDACIKSAEKAFAARDYDAALLHYKEALVIDPSNYNATLYTGDAYFASGHLEEAVQWFDRAIALDPNRETAYRYRGDALDKLHHSSEALNSFVAAVVADPYSRLPWNTLTVVAQRQGYFAKFRAAPLPKAEIKIEKGKCSIILPPDQGVLTLAYGTFRAAWISENQAGVLAGDHYRQSLAEEKKVLTDLLETALRLKESPEQKSNHDREVALTETSFLELKQIVDAGLLEPHILLTRANQDIAQDYAAYRDRNREKIAAYIERFYLGKE
jgi:tetratricopeptide (TPR) repeat protein